MKMAIKQVQELAVVDQFAYLRAFLEYSGETPNEKNLDIDMVAFAHMPVNVVEEVTGLSYKEIWEKYSELAIKDAVRYRKNDPNATIYTLRDGDDVYEETFYSYEDAYDKMCRLYFESKAKDPKRYGIWRTQYSEWNGQRNSMTQAVWGA